MGEQIAGGVKLTSERMKEIQADLDSRKSNTRYAADEVLAVRDEALEVRIDFPTFNNKPVGPKDVATYNAFLRRRFSRIMPEKIMNEPIILPARLAHAGFLTVQHLQPAGEWMSVGLGLQPGAPA